MIIHAPSIHSGGGKVLLDPLLIKKTFGPISHLICDTRYVLPEGFDPTIKVFRVRATLLSRWKAESLLKKISDEHPGQNILCFSNLPPAFKLNNKVILYLQNALLLPGMPFYVNSFRMRLRFVYEKTWSRLFWEHVDEVWVQTNWMKKALENVHQKVEVKPFLPTLPLATDLEREKKYDFITISGAVEHKRLLPLLEAWTLFPESFKPSLFVVTDGMNAELTSCYEKLKNKNVTIKMDVNREEVFKLYQESRALIVTSRVESFCLPIYEAAHFKLKIFSVDEPFARDSGLVDDFIDLSSPDKTTRSLENIYQRFFSLK